MTAITAKLVSELRERTSVGMMECKKALVENNGDIEAAAEYLRKTGLAKADKKADRVTAEGRVATAQAGGKAILVEVNSETDFTAKNDGFIEFADSVAEAGLKAGAKDIDTLKAAAHPAAANVEEATKAKIATIGENIQVRRMA